MARPQGGTSFLERAAIVYSFAFFLLNGVFRRTRAEGCLVVVSFGVASVGRWSGCRVWCGGGESYVVVTADERAEMKSSRIGVGG
jgi:hypothetical protein